MAKKLSALLGRRAGPGPGNGLIIFRVIARPPSCPPDLVGRHHPRRDLGVAEAAPMTSTRRWTGWHATSRLSWPPPPGPQANLRGWRCSTCPRGWRGGAAAGRRGYSGTARPAADRVRAAHRPGRIAGRGPGVPRQHRRLCRVHQIVAVVREKFGLAKMVMVGDRGMITSAGSQREPAGDGTAGRTLRVDHRAARPVIKKLLAEDGPLQLSLFDQQDLAEITSGDYPGERLVACRNSVLAANGPQAEVCWPPPRNCWLSSSPGWPPGGWPEPRRSASRWAR